jgi:hypothetical protein
MASVSALSCPAWSFSARRMACWIFAHVGDADHNQAGLAGVEVLAELLEVVAAHPGGGVPDPAAEDAPSRVGSHACG